MDYDVTWLNLTQILIKCICNVITKLQITSNILLPRSQQPATLPYAESDKFHPPLLVPFLPELF